MDANAPGARVGAIKDYKPFNRATIPQRNADAPTQPNRVVHVPASAPTNAAGK
jgi:hypothetical protein